MSCVIRFFSGITLGASLYEGTGPIHKQFLIKWTLIIDRTGRISIKDYMNILSLIYLQFLNHM